MCSSGLSGDRCDRRYSIGYNQAVVAAGDTYPGQRYVHWVEVRILGRGMYNGQRYVPGRADLVKEAQCLQTDCKLVYCVNKPVNGSNLLLQTQIVRVCKWVGQDGCQSTFQRWQPTADNSYRVYSSTALTR